MQHQSNQSLRQSVLDALVAAAPSGTSKAADYFKTAGGIEILSGSERETAENLCDELAKYGLFIVRRGEVEAWLGNLNVPQKTNGWRAKIFAALGSDPSASTYVRASSGDVWDFVGSLQGWFGNSARRGIPD